MALMTNTYTTQTEMEAIFGEEAISQRLDDNEDDVLDIVESNYLDDCINEATNEINFYLLERYDAATLLTNTWVRRAASYLANHFLSERQGDPEQYTVKVDRIYGRLQQIQDRKRHLPGDGEGEGTRHDGSPSLSNLVVDHRYRLHKLRVQQRISTGGADGDQDGDIVDYFDP